MSFLQASRSRDIVFAIVFSLIASLLVLLPNAATPAKATSHGITYNDQVCDLTTAGYAGDGSAGSPYQITDADGLWEVTDCSSPTTYFELTQDIDVSSALHAPTTSPIGFSTSSVIYSFSGVLTGAGSGVRIHSLSVSNDVGVGLFSLIEEAQFSRLRLEGQFRSSVYSSGDDKYASGALASRAITSNTISDVSNYATVSGRSRVGGIIGIAAGNVTFDRAENLGSVEAENQYAGGLVGRTDGGLVNIVESSNHRHIFANLGYAGGLVGFTNNSGSTFITSSWNAGPVFSWNQGVGGAIGYVQAGPVTVNRFSNSGEITSDDSLSGGLVGFSNVAISVSNSLNEATVFAPNGFVGGLIGELYGTLWVSRFSNTKAIEAQAGYVGGLVGYANLDVSVFHSINTGSITGLNRSGGLVGEMYGSLEVNTFTNSATVSGELWTAGVAGYVDVNVSMSGVANLGSVSGSDEVGGLVGGTYGSETSIKNSLNTGDVRGGNWVGGVVGSNGTALSLNHVVNQGAISGTNWVGGLTGAVSGNSVFNSVGNSGDVAGLTKVGGLIGSSSGTINSTLGYSGGLVSGNSLLNAIVGSYSSTVTLDRNVVRKMELDTQELAVTHELTEMRTSTPYESATGWDFTSTWGFGTCSENNGLPMLRVFNQVSTFYTTGCFTAPQQQQSADPAPAPVYAGPVLDPVKVSVSTGERMVLTGSRLETVVEISIGDIKQQIISVAPAAIEILVSSSTSEGVQDLVLVSAFGTLTAQAAIDVSSGSVTSGEGQDLSLSDTVNNELIGKTRMLSLNAANNESWMESNLGDSGLKRVVCTATVREGATHHQRVQARKLAKAACEQVAGYLVEPSTWFQTKETRSRFVGRVFLTVKG